MCTGSLFDGGSGFPGRLGFHLSYGFGPRISRTNWLGGIRFLLGLTDRPDHVEGTLGIVRELIIQDALTAVERVVQADVLSLDATELLGREKRLGQKSLQPGGRPTTFRSSEESCSIPSMAMMSLSSSYCASVLRISCARR